MNLIEIGKLISKLRKDAGYTQKTLADALYVSDKAVSKWERGICMPNSTLLNKLSMLLNVDIEHLMTGQKPYVLNDWYGEIRCTDLKCEIHGKPLIHYLISYLMLAGIKNISIETDDREYIQSLNLTQFGINLRFNECRYNKRTIVIYDKFFLFGSNITRYFNSYASNDSLIIPFVDDIELPIIFTDKPQFSVEWHRKKCEHKTMGRGIVFIPLNNDKQFQDATLFIDIYEKYHLKEIANLEEIAKNRGLV